MPELTIKEQDAETKDAYRKHHGIFYRAGIVMQVLGAALLAVLYPLGNPFYTLGIMCFESGVLLAAIYLVIERPLVKKILLLVIAFGLVLQIAGFYVAEDYAGLAIMGGISLVCAGAAGMASNEAYRMKCLEGWMLSLFGFPTIIIANLFFKENHIFNSLCFSGLFLLLLSLAGKTLKQFMRSGQKIDGNR